MLFHCIIPVGALSFDRKKWIAARKKYLFRVQSLAKEFRKRYLTKLEKLYRKNKLSFYGRATRYRDEKQFIQLIEQLRDTQWITYAQQPFGGPEQVLEYLGRYTHRVALTNNRVLATDNNSVRFSYRDRSDDNKRKVLAVSGEEFIRRFLLHVLPRGFTKIRYFGFLAHANKNTCIPLIRALIDTTISFTQKLVEGVQEMMLRLTGVDIGCCPKCGQGTMVVGVPITRVAFDTS